MLRSAEMALCNIYIQPEAAFEVMSHLGEMGCVQILDANEEVKAFQRKFVPEMCRCAEMERKLRYIENEMQKDDIIIPNLLKKPKAMQPHELLPLENTLEKWENDIAEMSSNQVQLMKNYLQLNEMSYVLKHLGPLLGTTDLVLDRKYARGLEISEGGHLYVITGVVRRDRCLAFETMLWRVSHGNVYYRQAYQDKLLIDPYTGQGIRKVAFLIVCQGEELNQRIKKICEGFKAGLHECPSTADERREMIDKVDVRLNDLEHVLKKTKFYRCKALRTVGRTFRGWATQVKKTRAIYHHLNLFTLDITNNCLFGKCWVAKDDLKMVQTALAKCSKLADSPVECFLQTVPTDDTPPTFHRTNKFTRGFQNLINAYGTANYMELNPGLFTIITFPFLFGMMFSDMGHGIILVLFGMYMVVNEKKFQLQQSNNEIWNIFFTGRYIILLMGIFSVYTGFVYNDIFAKCLVLIPSAWKNGHSAAKLENKSNKFVSLIAKENNGQRHVYYLGLDPVWLLSKNRIVFQNSIKMKLSIIFGVIHMIFGIILSYYNHRFFKHNYAVFLEFIPQLVFLSSLFLYLVFLMFYKWLTYSVYAADPKRKEGCAPLLLIFFIDMILQSTTKPVAEECDAYMFSYQQQIQRVLVAVAVLCIPVMLLGPPLWKYKMQKEEHISKGKQVQFSKTIKSGSLEINDEEMGSPEESKLPNVRKEPKQTFADLMITQGVETIEFVLSCISHTASYLRLWALSLAHAELSDMLWLMVLENVALKDHSYFGIMKLYIIFAAWAFFTVGIMVVMEGLSAFLHTLRLHWVEFMSKFFAGGGTLFRPFSFKAMLSSANEDDKVNVCLKEKATGRRRIAERTY